MTDKVPNSKFQIPKPYYEENGITIYCGDAYLISSGISADVLCSDPQYGIGFKTNAKRSRCEKGLNFADRTKNIRRDPAWLALQDNDRRPFEPAPFLRFSEMILWGANNYSHLLPTSRGWLVWDKLKGKTPTCFGDCELAWTNIDMPIRIWSQLWRGIVREGEENLNIQSKVHPCQKPAALMRWALQFTKGKTVFDPFMGSGTTLLAAKDLGRQSIGIEIEERYCEIAARRLQQEVLQLS